MTKPCKDVRTTYNPHTLHHLKSTQHKIIVNIFVNTTIQHHFEVIVEFFVNNITHYLLFHECPSKIEIFFIGSLSWYMIICTKNCFLNSKPSYICIINILSYTVHVQSVVDKHGWEYSPCVFEKTSLHRTISALN